MSVITNRKTPDRRFTRYELINPATVSWPDAAPAASSLTPAVITINVLITLPKTCITDEMTYTGMVSVPYRGGRLGMVMEVNTAPGTIARRFHTVFLVSCKLPADK
jgi:hypothetical protein